jgi:integrase
MPNLYKRCSCSNQRRCQHPFWYEFELYGDRYRASTRTSERRFAGRITAKRRAGVIAEHEGVPPPDQPTRLGVPSRTEPLPCVSGFEQTGGLATGVSDRPTLAALIRDYRQVTQGEHGSWPKTCAVLQSFELFMHDRPLEKVDSFAIECWRSKRLEQVSGSTANREMTVIQGLYTRAVRWGRVTASPMVGIRRLKADEVPRRVLTPAELRLVLDNALPSVALMFRVTLECLPRLSEVLGLRRQHVNDTWLDIQRKGGSIARIPVVPDLRDKLRAHCHRSGWVFGRDDRKGLPPSPAVVSGYVAKLMRRLNLPGVSHHTMRHTGTTMMLDQGISPRAVQYFGGWTTLRMVERYGHVQDAELRRAVDVTHNLIMDALSEKAVCR